MPWREFTIQISSPPLGAPKGGNFPPLHLFLYTPLTGTVLDIAKDVNIDKETQDIDIFNFRYMYIYIDINVDF